MNMSLTLTDRLADFKFM